MTLPDPNLVPISPDQVAEQRALSPEEEARLLLETFGLPAVSFKAPRKQNANLKAPKKPSPSGIFGDLLPPAPINPRFVWTAVAVEFHHQTIVCTCAREYLVPMEPMCVWTRPHGEQRVTNRRFPRNYHELGLPTSTVAHPPARVNGCPECLKAVPQEVGDSPLGDDPTPLATPFAAPLDTTSVEDINDLLP